MPRRAGAVHVFLNSCRHRGMKVCRYEQGNTSLFVCPYHSWSYTTDGKLQGVPLYRALYDGTLNREEWSLIEVPRLAILQGHGVGIVGSRRARLPGVSRRRGRSSGPGAGLPRRAAGRLGGDRRAQMGVPVELEIRGGELPRRHLPQSVAPLRGHDRHGSERPAGHSGGTTNTPRGSTSGSGFPQGHGMTQRVDAGAIANITRPISSIRRSTNISAIASTNGSAGWATRRGTCCRSSVHFFPNASYHGRQPRGICVWHPHSPTETEGWRFFLVDADAPAEVKDVLRHYYMRYSGPAGMTEQDDMENWLYATRGQQGDDRAALSVQLPDVDGRVQNTTDLGPGEVATQMTDQTPRNFYRAYTRYLNGDDWDSLLGRDMQPIRGAAE